jgi:hypothetical protein
MSHPKRRDHMTRAPQLVSSAAILVTIPALFVAPATTGQHPQQAQATKVGQAAGTWKVTVPDNGDPWRIAHGSGLNSPQVAALDTRSGYFRLVSGTTWGTSVVLPPPFWSGATLFQGMPIKATHRVDGDRLIIDALGERHGLKVHVQVALSPPGAGRISAEVWGQSDGQVALDTRPGEAFKVVMLSSMHIAPTRWDASSVIIEDRSPLAFDDASQVSSFFVAPNPPVKARRFGLQGGMSCWQEESGSVQPAPTVEIVLDGPLQIAGYRTHTTNPNDDNLGLWAATDKVLDAWHYTIIASRPTN